MWFRKVRFWNSNSRVLSAQAVLMTPTTLPPILQIPLVHNINPQMIRIMKKLTIITGVLLSMGMLALSCNKVETETEQEIEVPEETIEEAQPVEMLFSAEVSAKEATKSVDASGVTAWLAGETLAMYYQKNDDSYALATVTVGTPRGDGSAPITATLANAKNGSALKFVYPASLSDASGDFDPSLLAAQHGTIEDISDNFYAATGTGTLVTDGTSCSTSESVKVTNQILIGKFIPKASGTAISGITKLTIIDGTYTYTITPESTPFDDQGIYVAMMPVDSKEVTIAAETGSGNYTFSKSGITLEVGNLYNNLAIPMVSGNLISVSTSTADALRTTLASAASGDVILMAAGTYVESNSDYIAFDGKDVTVRAASGAKVIIQAKVPVTISNGATAKFVDVTFDASHLIDLADWYEHVIYATDANVNNKLILENCELKGFGINKSAIYCSSSNVLASISINNCLFHDNMKSCVFTENTSYPKDFTMTNSTIANISTNTESYWAGIFDIRSTTAAVKVDHCTFYNCNPMNTDYGAIGKGGSSTVVISNSIFMLPTATDGIRVVKCPGGTVNYCLVFNYLKDSGWGIHSNLTKSSCINSDPKFVDAENNNFKLDTGSPALTASSTGGPIGDPRWY